MLIKNLSYIFTPINTIGDGSCLIHSILQAFSTKYNKLKSNSEKSKLAMETRYNLSQILELEVENNKTVYQFLSRGQLEEISKEIKLLSIDNMKLYLNSSKYLTFHFIELLSEVFDINIIIISEKENDIYQTGDNELLLKPTRDCILINYIDQTHFETIKVNNKTVFKFNDEIIQKLFKN
jgi:hypothetical protein